MVHFKRAPAKGPYGAPDAYAPVGIGEHDRFETTEETDRASHAPVWESGHGDGYSGGFSELEQPTVLSPIIKGARTHVTMPTTPVLAIPRTRQQVVISVPTDAQQNRDIKYAFDAQGIFYNVEEYPDVTHWYVPEDQAQQARSIIASPGKFFGGGLGNQEGIEFLRDTAGFFSGMGMFGDLAYVDFSAIFSRVAPLQGHKYYWGGWPAWTARALAQQRNAAASAAGLARDAAYQAQQDPTVENIKAAQDAKRRAIQVAKTPPMIPAIPRQLRGLGADGPEEAFAPVRHSDAPAEPPPSKPSVQEIKRARVFARATARRSGEAVRRGPYQHYRDELREIQTHEAQEAKQRTEDLISMGVEPSGAQRQAQSEMQEGLAERGADAQNRAAEEANSLIEATAQSVADQMQRGELDRELEGPVAPAPKEIAGLGQEPPGTSASGSPIVPWVVGGILVASLLLPSLFSQKRGS